MSSRGRTSAISNGKVVSNINFGWILMHDFIQRHSQHETVMIIMSTSVIKVWTRHHGCQQSQECLMPGSLGTGHPLLAGVSLWQLLVLLLLTTFLNCIITHPQILLNLPLNLSFLQMFPSFIQSMKSHTYNTTNQTEPMGGPKNRPLVGHWLFPYEFFCFCISLFPWTKMFAEIWIWFNFWLQSLIRISRDNWF